MRDFRQLRVWEDAHQITLEIYKITKSFPKEELFGLTSQLRRASASIPSNIAEGCGRGSNKDYAHFLQMAIGSAYEVDYQLLLAKDLAYIDAENYLLVSKKIDTLKRQLASLLQKVRTAS
jgi:four helix bundle protein